MGDRIDLTDKGSQVLPPLAVALSRRLDIDPADPAAQSAVSDGLTAAFTEGVRAGAAEVAARAIERGVDIGLRFDVDGFDEPRSQ